MRTAILLLLSLATACSAASAPVELAVTALTFKPDSGKARIYVFRPDRFVGSGVYLPVAVDSLVVGKTSPGTFVMLDVNPGRHRVSSPTLENESATVVEALADSVYFFKVWPKVGFFAAHSGIERMVDAEGATAVRGARMVVTTWPGKPMADDGVQDATASGQGMP
jgi:hypothetical protein